MQINHSEYTVTEIVERLESREIRINREYQRGAGIWPQSAQTYFIDTILEDYPFPKLYFHQIYDRARKKPVMEVVDGQQRIMTIQKFLDNKLRLSKASKSFAGKTFDMLDEDMQIKFRMHRIQADVILAAERPELLEMFRRINAYTAPLNNAEKRHAQYHGSYKWFAVELADRIDPILEAFGVLTTKQMIRMADAELISELVVLLERGLVSRSERHIADLYKRYDDDFSNESKYRDLISNFFVVLQDDFSLLKGTLLAKSYAIHSLFAVYAHCQVGIPNGEEVFGFGPNERKFRTDREAVETLLAIGEAQEIKDEKGRFGKYVKAALETTTKAAQRTDRAKVMASVLVD